MVVLSVCQGVMGERDVRIRCARVSAEEPKHRGSFTTISATRKAVPRKLSALCARAVHSVACSKLTSEEIENVPYPPYIALQAFLNAFRYLGRVVLTDCQIVHHGPSAGGHEG